MSRTCSTRPAHPHSPITPCNFLSSLSDGGGTCVPLARSPSVGTSGSVLSTTSTLATLRRPSTAVGLCRSLSAGSRTVDLSRLNNLFQDALPADHHRQRSEHANRFLTPGGDLRGGKHKASPMAGLVGGNRTEPMRVKRPQSGH